MKYLQLNVIGRVQGVGFRYFTKKCALRLQLQGQVQNLQDGSVLIIVKGEDKAIHIFVDCVNQGPSSAKVDAVKISEINNFEADNFVINRAL